MFSAVFLLTVTHPAAPSTATLIQFLSQFMVFFGPFNLCTASCGWKLCVLIPVGGAFFTSDYNKKCVQCTSEINVTLSLEILISVRKESSYV